MSLRALIARHLRRGHAEAGGMRCRRWACTPAIDSGCMDASGQTAANRRQYDMLHDKSPCLVCYPPNMSFSVITILMVIKGRWHTAAAW